MTTPYEASPPDEPKTRQGRSKRWLWIAGVAVAFLAGLGIGAAVTTSEPRVVTKEVPGQIPQADLDALDAREAELDQRSAELGKREAALDERENELDQRSAEIRQQEQTIAANTITDGVWVVGTDIEPGTYRAQNVPSDCYWAITVSGSNGEDIINNDIPGGGNPTVTLSEGQDFTTQRCGEWHRQ